MEKDELELLILTDDIGTGGIRGKNGMQYRLTILAYIEKVSNKLVEQKTTLVWEEEQKYHFDRKTIYAIKGIVESRDANSNIRNFIVTEIIEKNVENAQLNLILEKYNTPVIKQDDELGEFILDKRFNMFNGKVNWLGNNCDIFLSCLDNVDNYEDCLNHFKSIYSNLEEYNKKFIDAIVCQLLDTANKWNDDREEPITKEEFMNTLKISECSMDKSGYYIVYYSCGDIFDGHIISVRGDMEKGIREVCF